MGNVELVVGMSIGVLEFLLGVTKQHSVAFTAFGARYGMRCRYCGARYSATYGYTCGCGPHGKGHVSDMSELASARENRDFVQDLGRGLQELSNKELLWLRSNLDCLPDIRYTPNQSRYSVDYLLSAAVTNEMLRRK